MARLQPPTAPRLPDPDKSGVTPFYLGALLGALRTYFERLGATINRLIGVTGGAYLEFPLVDASLTGPVVITDTAQALEPSEGAFIGFSEASGVFTATHSGLYQVVIAGYAVGTDTGTRVLQVWVEAGGAAVRGSLATVELVDTAGGVFMATSMVELPIASGLSIQARYVGDEGVQLQGSAAADPLPAVPAATIRVKFLAATL
jgi:hypothetical protein